MYRPTKEDIFMSMAETLSMLGTCDRKQVGCIIVRQGRCITWGYNGAPPGAPHCEENTHGWMTTSEKIRHAPPEVVEGWESAARAHLDQQGCRNATHAEANALAFAARQGISTEGSQVFVTVSPCEVCARLLIAAGVTDVYYLEEYRDVSGVQLLDKAQVYTHHMTN